MIGQPGGGNHADAIADLIGRRGVDGLDVAVAYATTSGVVELLRHISSNPAASKAWNGVSKRWLVGIDWMRTDPAALTALAGLAGSTVRIHDGAHVVTRVACWPRISWHPKHFAVTGTDVRGAVSGSANLSRNGLTIGHEFGSSVCVRSPSNATERKVDASLKNAETWFNSVWRSASALSTVATAYAALGRPTTIRGYGVTDDDAAPSTAIARTTRPALPAEMLTALRTANVLWIQSGKLTENLGRGNPGNQLMMSRFTRVFFGFAARDVPQNTALGDVVIAAPGGGQRTTRSMRFSDNSMDVLSIPPPGGLWPNSWDNVVVQFRRVVSKGAMTFEIRILSSAEAAAARRRSITAGTMRAMTSGREWGVY